METNKPDYMTFSTDVYVWIEKRSNLRTNTLMPACSQCNTLSSEDTKEVPYPTTRVVVGYGLCLHGMRLDVFPLSKDAL